MQSLSVDESTIGQYVKYQEVFDGLDLPDDVNKEEILTILKEANQDIQIKLKPHAAALPLPEGTENFKAASRAGLIYVNARWKEKKHNFDLAAKLDTRYERKMNDLIKAIKSEPLENPRTKSLLIASDPRDAKLPLPTQYPNFVFDDFA